MSVCSLLTALPSGSSRLTGGSFSPLGAGSARAARKSKSFAHFRGFLALTTYSLEESTKA